MGLFTGNPPAKSIFDEPFYWFQKMLLRMIPTFFRVTKIGGPAVVDLNSDGTCPPGFRRESYQGRPYCLVLGVPGPSPQEDTEDEEGEEEEETDEESREDTESSQDGDEGEAEEEEEVDVNADTTDDETGFEVEVPSGEIEVDPESNNQAFVASALEGFNNEETRQKNKNTIGELYSSLSFGEGEWDSVLGRETLPPGEDQPINNEPWWLRGNPNDTGVDADLERMLDDFLNRLPGVGVVFKPDAGGVVRGRVLIPIPGLPEYIQGNGLEVDILDNGEIVITEAAKNKINEIKEKIKSLPNQIKEGIENTISGILEAGEEIGDIFTDNDGNIFVNVVDAAGSILRRVAVTAGGLLDGADGKEGLLGWLLASGVIGSAVETTKTKYFPPAAGEGEDEGEPDGTGDDGQPQEEPPPDDENKDPPVTGEEERDRHDPERRDLPEGQKGDGPVPGDDISSTGEEAGPDGVWTGDQYKQEQDGEEPGQDGGEPRPDGGPVEPGQDDEGRPGPDGGDGSGDSFDTDDRDSSGGVVTSGTDDVKKDEPFTGGGGGGMLTGGGRKTGTGYMDNLGYGLSDFVPVQYQLKDYNVALNRLINDSLFRGIV